MTALTVSVPEQTAEKLERLARKLSSSRDSLAARAIEDFVAREVWQIAEIEAGLAEAERGDFAAEGEVARVLGKYRASATGA